METFYEVWRPACGSGAYYCDKYVRVAISPDGATLFFLGDQKLVVQPVDASLRALGGPRVDARPQAGRPLPWRPAAAAPSSTR